MPFVRRCAKCGDNFEVYPHPAVCPKCDGRTAEKVVLDFLAKGGNLEMDERFNTWEVANLDGTRVFVSPTIAAKVNAARFLS